MTEYHDKRDQPGPWQATSFSSIRALANEMPVARTQKQAIRQGAGRII